MRILRHLGFAGLLIGSLFKIFHWPGANILVLSGAGLVLIANMVSFVRSKEYLSTGTTITRVVGLFLVVSAVLHLLHIPDAVLMIYGAAGAASFLLLSERAGLRMKDVRAPRLPGLLATGLTLLVTGGLFTLMHWPSANIQLLAGLLVCASWILATMRESRSSEQPLPLKSPGA